MTEILLNVVPLIVIFHYVGLVVLYLFTKTFHNDTVLVCLSWPMYLLTELYRKGRFPS